MALDRRTVRTSSLQRCLSIFLPPLSFLIGVGLDFLYFDAFSSTAFPIATIIALSFATISTPAAYYGGSDIILVSLGAERLNLQIPEHREFVRTILGL